MDGTVRYVLIEPHRMPLGPVSMVLSKSGVATVCIDDAQMDPLLPPVIAEWSNELLRKLMLDVAPDRRSLPAIEIRVHRDKAMGGSDLIVADLTPRPNVDMLDVFLPHELVTREVVREIGQQATCLMHRFK
jgi:hypothetical protein